MQDVHKYLVRSCHLRLQFERNEDPLPKEDTSAPSACVAAVQADSADEESSEKMLNLIEMRRLSRDLLGVDGAFLLRMIAINAGTCLT